MSEHDFTAEIGDGLVPVIIYYGHSKTTQPGMSMSYDDFEIHDVILVNGGHTIEDFVSDDMHMSIMKKCENHWKQHS
jgi:hypothetical protein